MGTDYDYRTARDEQRRALRAAMLDAATRLLSDGGFDAMSVRAIAQEVGASTRVIYSHFGGKPGIVEALYLDGFSRLADALRGGTGSGPAPERLVGVGRAYRAFAIGSPRLYELMFGPRVRELLPDPDHRAPVLAASSVVAGIVAEGQAAGEVVAGDATTLTKFLWSALHGTVSMELTGWFAPEEGAANHDRLVQAAIDAVTP